LLVSHDLDTHDNGRWVAAPSIFASDFSGPHQDGLDRHQVALIPSDRDRLTVSLGSVGEALS
jgi:hypothetical protein